MVDKQQLKKIGIIGCGAIGSKIARAIDEGKVSAELIGVCDVDAALAEKLSASLKCKAPALAADALAQAADLVVEAAQVSAVGPAVELCVKLGKDLMVMSVGGVTAEHFAMFNNSPATLYLPSGAVCGLDGIIASNLERIDSISLTTRKPPAGLKGASYLQQNNISVDNLSSEKVVFEGTPAEAIRAFPKNINVSRTLSLAAAADDKFTVRIVADPAAKNNTHEVRLSGALGSITVIVENVPSPDNPKTSALAYYSAIATLKKILSHVKIGS